MGIELNIVEVDSPAQYPGAFEKMRAAEVQGLDCVRPRFFSRRSYLGGSRSSRQLADDL